MFRPAVIIDKLNELGGPHLNLHERRFAAIQRSYQQTQISSPLLRINIRGFMIPRPNAYHRFPFMTYNCIR